MPNLLKILLLEYPDENWIKYDLSHNQNSPRFINWYYPYKKRDNGTSTKWETIYNMYGSNVVNDYVLSLSPNVTWEMIKSNPNIGWFSTIISKNLNITPEIVADNPDYDWDYFCLNQNPNMQWNHLKKYYNSFEDSDVVKQCIGNILKENPNITWEIYNKHLKLPPIDGYCCETYCINPNITYENIKCIELTDFDFSSLSRNKFKYSTDLQHVWQKRLTSAHNKLKKQELQRLLRYKIGIPRHFIQ